MLAAISLLLLFEGGTSLGRNVDVSDWDGIALHMQTKTCQLQPVILYPLKALHCSDFKAELFHL